MPNSGGAKDMKKALHANAQLLKGLNYSHEDDMIFEHHLPSDGLIDVWIRDANVLIEQ